MTSGSLIGTEGNVYNVLPIPVCGRDSDSIGTVKVFFAEVFDGLKSEID